ncbi:hypothetical protein FB451DRAFT_1189883 [Mycena latifolia]|nr:hypothetical protein FB451DRAFT_1189883 [Mycena latifolia]
MRGRDALRKPEICGTLYFELVKWMLGLCCVGRTTEERNGKPQKRPPIYLKWEWRVGEKRRVRAELEDGVGGSGAHGDGGSEALKAVQSGTEFFPRDSASAATVAPSQELDAELPECGATSVARAAGAELRGRIGGEIRGDRSGHERRGLRKTSLPLEPAFTPITISRIEYSDLARDWLNFANWWGTNVEHNTMGVDHRRGERKGVFLNIDIKLYGLTANVFDIRRQSPVK